MESSLRLRSLDADAARAAAPGWTELYNACFTEPPWSEPPRTPDEYVTTKQPHLAQPGLCAVEAHAADGRLLGLTYGWPAAAEVPDMPFYQGLRAGLDDATWDALWAAKPFEVVEFMVDPAARGQGLGRKLLAALCADHPVCWLATRPEAPAAAIYQHLGWRRFGWFTVPPTDLPLEAYLLDQRGNSFHWAADGTLGLPSAT